MNLLASRGQWEEFFEESLLWQDLQTILKDSIADGTQQLELVGLHGAELDALRGKVAALREWENLPEIVYSWLDSEEEEKSDA